MDKYNDYLPYEKAKQMTVDGYVPQDKFGTVMTPDGTIIEQSYLFENDEVWAVTQDDWNNFYNIEETDMEDVEVDDEPGEVDPENTSEPETNPVVDAITKLQEEVKTANNKYLLAVADLDNFRKRTNIEKENIRKYQDESLAKDLIPIIDNFERALKVMDEDDPHFEGLNLIYTQLITMLGKHEITPMALNEHDVFDDSIMNATGVINVPGFEKNEIISVQNTGYTIKDKVLRYANVLVQE